jgi:hypothetical protein
LHVCGGAGRVQVETWLADYLIINIIKIMAKKKEWRWARL